MPAPASVNAAKELSGRWRRHGFDVDLSTLFYAGDRNPVIDYLSGQGWEVSARPRPEVFADYGRHFPATDDFAALRNSLAVTAIRE